MIISIIKDIYKFNKGKFCLGIFLIILNATLEFLGVATIIPIIGNFLNDNSTSEFIISKDLISLNQLLFLFICLIVLKNIISAYYAYFINLHIATYKSYLSTEIFNRIVSQNYIFFINNKTSEMFQSIHEDPYIYANNCVKTSLFLLADILISIAVLTTLLFVNFKITISIYFSLFLMFYFSYILFIKISHNLGQIRRKTNTNLISFINKYLSSVKDIKIYESNNYFISGLKKNIIDNSNCQAIFSWIQSLPKSLFEVILIIILAINIIFMSKFNSNEQIISYIGVFVFVSIRLLSNINRCFSYIQQIKFSRPSQIKVKDSLNMVLNNLSPKNSLGNFKNIELKKINLSLNNKKILQNINFKFKKNQINGIFGQSGSGKSKITEITMGLIDPSSGNIIFDNNGASKNYPGFLNIGYASHNNPMLNDTIENNILFGRPKLNNHKEKLIKLFDITGLNIVVQNLNDKERYIINDLENNISTGQKQRIGLCRALYLNNDLVILDESTNALDKKSENFFFENLKINFPNTTFIIISHTQDVIKYCTNVLKI